MMIDRITAGIFIVLGLAILFSASGFYVPYQYEPLGPKAMPYLVGTLLLVCGFRLLLVPSEASNQSLTSVSAASRWKQLFCAGWLLAYAFSYESLGFIVATSLLGFGLAWVCGARLPRSLSIAAGLPLFGHLVLVAGLDLQLPSGLLAAWL